jgi:hypothetical protein
VDMNDCSVVETLARRIQPAAPTPVVADDTSRPVPPEGSAAPATAEPVPAAPAAEGAH